MKTRTIVGFLIVATVTVALFGCATHRSSLKSGSGTEEIFVIDEARLFNDTYRVISEVFPNNPIFDVDGPIRGFYVQRRLGPDRYTTMVRLFPAKGSTQSGIAEGYYIEVSGEGTMFDGPNKDQESYDQIMQLLGRIAKRVAVSDAQRTDYKLERDRWKLRPESGSSTNDAADVKTRLMKLEELYKNGLISKEEYDSKRAEILADL